MKSYAVIGLGRFGTRVATSLYEFGEDVLAIDTDAELVNEIADSVTRAAAADAENKNELKRLGVAQCDCAIVAMGSDLASSVLVTMNLKSLGVPYIICKAQNDTHREILEKLGADKVVIPEREMAEKTARSLASPDFLEYIDLSEECGIIEIASPRSWTGKTLKDLNIRSKYGINVIAVKSGEKILVSVSADYQFKSGDTVVVLGEYSALNKIKGI